MAAFIGEVKAVVHFADTAAWRDNRKRSRHVTTEHPPLSQARDPAAASSFRGERAPGQLRASRVGTSMQAYNRQRLVERLANKEDDLYLFADAPEIEDVVAQELLPNPLVVLARDDHPLAGERNIPFERLAKEPFLIREEGSGARRIAMRLFGEHGLTPRIRMELGTNEAIKEAILAGLGVTIMSRYTFGLDPETSRYLCLDVQGFPLENHWYLVYPEGKQLSSLARAFLDFARAEAKRLVPDSLGRR